MATTSVVHRDPNVQGGVPVLRGTRVPPRNLIASFLEGGEDLDTFLADFPSLRREHAIAALEGWEAVTALQAAPLT